MAEKIMGLFVLVIVIASIVLTYHKHMSAIWKDIAREEADELFDSYVQNCEYRVHTELHTMILDETK